MGVLAGLVIAVSVLALPRAFGQSVAGPMSSMMGQMMQDPRFMESMASACAAAMNDPAVLRSMQQAMQSPPMRQMMQQMLELMQGR